MTVFIVGAIFFQVLKCVHMRAAPAQASRDGVTFY